MGMNLLPGCRSDLPDKNSSVHNWQTNDEWQQIRYGEWGGPGVDPRPGPMDHILLKDYAPKSSVVVPETFVDKARFPVIDVHIHDYAGRAEGNATEILAEWVETMDEVGIEKSVVLTGTTGAEFDRLVDMYLRPYPGKFQLYCGLESTNIHQTDYPEQAAAELERCFDMGARGVGELTDKGLGVTRDPDLQPEERMHFDDSRLDLFWSKCGELNMPVNIHIADHPSAWEALDIFQERTPEYQHFNLHGDDILSHAQLLVTRDRLIEQHPDTTFIACHLSNQGHDLASLSRALDKYPNLCLDISARDYEIGRTPRTAKKFLEKYSDRVLFGTDMGMYKGMYQSWWRLLETDDEYMVGRVWWPYYGLNLSESVLQALYRDNARRIMNWE